MGMVKYRIVLPNLSRRRVTTHALGSHPIRQEGTCNNFKYSLKFVLFVAVCPFSETDDNICIKT